MKCQFRLPLVQGAKPSCQVIVNISHHQTKQTSKRTLKCQFSLTLVQGAKPSCQVIVNHYHVCQN